MNIKLSAVLCGIASLVVAGFISFIPAFTSQAAPVSYSSQISSDSGNDYIFIDDNLNGYCDYISGTLSWTLYNLDLSANNIDWSGLYVEIYTDGTVYMEAGIRFDDDYADESSYGYCSYDFRYGGVDYTGVIVDYYCCACDLDGYAYYNLSDFNNAGAVKGFYKSIASKVNDINLAAQGLNADGSVNAEKTVEYKYNYAINYRIIQAVANAKDVALLYTFEYEGRIFQSTITPERAAEVFTLDIPWYGPCYIASNFPTVYLGEAE